MTKLKDTKLMLDGGARCSTCQTIKPSTAFHRDRSRTSGRSSRCKSCESKRTADRAMVTDLRRIAEKHPDLAELIVWAGEKLAA